MTDYNELGVEYTVYKQQAACRVGGYMPEGALTALQGVVAALHADAAEQAYHPWIRQYLGALHHLDGFLLAIETIVDHIDYLRQNLLSPEPCLLFPKTIVKREGQGGPLQPPALIGISTQRLEFEVETLLLKTAAILERIAKLIDFQCGLGGVWLFKGLKEKLEARPDDQQCTAILNLITDVTPVFTKTILADPDTKGCLRNAIAHEASSPELMDKGFTINWLADGSVLAFDAELDGIPLIATVREIARTTPFFVLQCIKILLERAPEGSNSKTWSSVPDFSQELFEPTWKNPFLHFSSLIDPEELGPRVSLFRLLPGGFVPHQRHLLPAVLEMVSQPTKI